MHADTIFVEVLECLKQNYYRLSDFAVFNDHPPELHELCDAAAEIADLYDQVGMGLGLTRGHAVVDKHRRQAKPDAAVSHRGLQLLEKWQDIAVHVGDVCKCASPAPLGSRDKASFDKTA